MHDDLEKNLAAAVESVSADTDPEAQWTKATVARRLRHLSLDHQIVLELDYFEGLRGPQLAAALEVPTGTVRSRLKRGLERLREEVERLAADPSLADSTMTGMETWAGEIQTALERPPST